MSIYIVFTCNAVATSIVTVQCISSYIHAVESVVSFISIQQKFTLALLQHQTQYLTKLAIRLLPRLLSIPSIPHQNLYAVPCALVLSSMQVLSLTFMT